MYLRIFVEGGDDEAFLNHLIEKNNYFPQNTLITKFGQEKDNVIRDILKTMKSLRHQNNTEFLFLHDSDFNYIQNLGTQVINAKRNFSTQFDIDTNDIIIVILMIESWYYAGLSPRSCREIGIDIYPNARMVTKQNLQHQAQKLSTTRKQLLFQIMDHFNIEIAKENNQSFANFLNSLSEIRDNFVK